MPFLDPDGTLCPVGWLSTPAPFHPVHLTRDFVFSRDSLFSAHPSRCPVLSYTIVVSYRVPGIYCRSNDYLRMTLGGTMVRTTTYDTHLLECMLSGSRYSVPGKISKISFLFHHLSLTYSLKGFSTPKMHHPGLDLRHRWTTVWPRYDGGPWWVFIPDLVPRGTPTWFFDFERTSVTLRDFLHVLS